jgi:hypothetical protein
VCICRELHLLFSANDSCEVADLSRGSRSDVEAAFLRIYINADFASLSQTARLVEEL